MPELPYDDGVRILFLNTKGNPDEDEELSELLRYIEDSREENARTEDMKKLHSYVEEVKHQHDVGGRSEKNHADAMIFLTDLCAGTSQRSLMADEKSPGNEIAVRLSRRPSVAYAPERRFI